MPDLKISLITVSYNAESTIATCIESVITQDYKNVQFIIIDGGSTDKTINIVNNYKHSISRVISEPDKGIYDAMNKGIRLATGDVIGMLNADDFFADGAVLSTVAEAFQKNNPDAVYADLDYIDVSGNVLRKWRSGNYAVRNFNFGWMPPHPTFYCKRNLFEKFGFYSLDFGTAADYELMLRFLYINKLTVLYIQKVIIKMKTGGKSNKNFSSRVKGLFFDLKAMQNNGISIPIFTVIAKPLRKIIQYF